MDMLGNSFYSILIFIVCCSLKVFGSIRHCPSGQYSWQYKDNCFEIIFSEKNWYRAREHCAGRGGDLAEIRNADIQQSIVNHLQRYRNGYHGFWIGATDTDQEGRWLWLHDSRPLTYSNWHPEQGPNRRGFFFGDIQDCAMIRSDDNYRWHDGPCNAGPAFHYSFICQYDKEISHSQKNSNNQTSTLHTSNTRLSESTSHATKRTTGLKPTAPYMINSPSTKLTPTHHARSYQSTNPIANTLVNIILTSRKNTSTNAKKLSTQTLPFKSTTASPLSRKSTKPIQQSSTTTKDYSVLLIG